jgi:ribokinase
MALKTISVIGSLDYDLIMLAPRNPNPGESLQANVYREGLGGKGANTAIATYRSCHTKPVPQPSPDSPSVPASPEPRANINVRMIGAVRDDTYGSKLREGLRQTGVDTSGIITVPDTQSSICFVMVENGTRENTSLFTPDATANWKKEHFPHPEDLGQGVCPDLMVPQMEIERSVVEQMIETAGRAGIDFVLNDASAKLITARIYRWLTYLVANKSEAAVLSGREVNERYLAYRQLGIPRSGCEECGDYAWGEGRVLYYNDREWALPRV